jgi:hypothetical protein
VNALEDRPNHVFGAVFVYHKVTLWPQTAEGWPNSGGFFFPFGDNLL